MPKLPILSGKEMIKILRKIGFVHIRTSGSHAILNKQDSVRGKITLPVPLHPELAKGTLKSIESFEKPQNSLRSPLKTPAKCCENGGYSKSSIKDTLDILFTLFCHKSLADART